MSTRSQKAVSSFILRSRRVLHVIFKTQLRLSAIALSLLLVVMIVATLGVKRHNCARPPSIIENNCPFEGTTFIAKLNYNYLDFLIEDCERSEKLIYYEPAATNIAIIVPYRRRENHLAVFLMNMNQFLQAQGIDYKIFVINQVDDNKFNRGSLLNVGFKEASKITSSDCFFFHDVDLIPESGKLTYCCSPTTIIHYASAMSTWNWRMPYCEFYGGIVAATRAQFTKANGFANRFWGWGGEDDEFGERVNASGQTISHLSEQTGRFYMFQHERDVGNEPDPERTEKLLKTKDEWQTDGLNSLNYTLIAIEERKFYTEIKVKF